MKRPRGVIAATALATTITALAAGAAAPASAARPPVGQIGPVGHVGAGGHVSAGTTTLPDSVAPFAAADRATGTVPAASRLTLQFWLAPRATAAEQYATAASTPGNPLFGHFLSPDAYAARFAATHGTADAVESWLSSAGFAGVSTDSGRDYVRATAPVSTIDRALGVRLQYYRAGREANAGGYPLRANDRPVSLPASIARQVTGVTGLDNAAPTSTRCAPFSLSAAAPASSCC